MAFLLLFRKNVKKTNEKQAIDKNVLSKPDVCVFDD